MSDDERADKIDKLKNVRFSMESTSTELLQQIEEKISNAVDVALQTPTYFSLKIIDNL